MPDWQVVTNPNHPGAFCPHRKRHGMFVKRQKNSSQIWASAELARRLGNAVMIYRNGHKFLLRPAGITDDHARLITGRGKGGTVRFTCRELSDALDEGRVYVKETREGFEL